MPLTTLNDSLLNIREGIIVHSVNCQKVAGRGLAKQIAEAYPAWLRHFQSIDPNLGGALLTVITAFPPLFVGSLYSQYNYGTQRRQTDYSAFNNALLNLKSMTERYPHLSVYFPYGIGCGLGGGDWGYIRPLIESHYPYAFIMRLP